MKTSRLWRAAFLMSLGLMTAASCVPDELDGARLGASCATQDDCPFFLTCSGGACRHRCGPDQCADLGQGTYCSTTANSPPAFVCREGVCVPNDATFCPGYDGGNYGYDTSYYDTSYYDDASQPACRGTAPSEADLDSHGGWKPPPAKQTVCSPADIAKFESNFAGAAVFTDLIRDLPAACGSCILQRESDAGDATWSFIMTDAAGTFGFVNYGACYARAEGGSDACGKAIQYREFCVTSSCASCASDIEKAACLKAPGTLKACDDNFGASIQAGCGTDAAKLQVLDNACGRAALAAAVLCGGGAPADSGGGG